MGRPELSGRRSARPTGVVLPVLALLLGLAACGDAPAPREGVAELASARQQSREQQSTGGLHQRLIGDADLPPEGTRSLLDKWLAEQGGIPFPFARMLEALAAEDADGARPPTVLIPDGRSLLKAQADFAQPRIVLAADMQPPPGALLAPDFRGRLYMGFTEAGDEIELISYNEAAGRFEFQLIKDYCEGCVPKLVYAQRGVCLTCHQGGVPIFSVRPWEETNADPDIAQRIEAAIGAQYHGLPTRVPLALPEALDNLTDQAAVLVATQRAWLDGCGEGGAGAQCRRAMLADALAWIADPGALQPGDPQRAAQRPHWPEAGIAIPDNDLRSRDPLSSGLYEDSLWAQLRRLAFGEPERAPVADKLAAFDELPPLPAEFDPLLPRGARAWIGPGDADAALGLALLLTPADRERLDAAANYDPARLQQAVASLPEQAFAPAPLRRRALLALLMDTLGVPLPAHRFDDLDALSPPLLDGEPPLELAADSPLQPFARYCFGCHRGNPSARLNFMSGPDPETVLARIRETDSIRDALDWERYLGTGKAGQLMPPEDSWQRDELEAALAAHSGPEPDPLAAMRDEVPSLFGF